MKGLIALVTAILAWGGPVAIANTDPRGTTCALAECVDRALAYSPKLKASESRVEAREQAHAQANAGYGPRLVADGAVQVWDQAISSDFGDIPGLPVDIEPVSFEVRPQVTWNLSITLAQPLTRLWTIYEASELAALGVDISRIERETARREVALETVRAWLQAATAAELIDVQRASLDARDGDVDRVQALVDAEAVDRSQLLRARLGRSDAQQRVTEAAGQRMVALAQLRAMVGAEIAPAPRPVTDDDGAGPLPAPPARDEAVAAGLADRLELAALGRRVDQARGAVDVARSELLPQVDAVAAAQLSNPSDLQPAESFFVGLNLSWTIWSWLGEYRGIDEARAEARAAQFQLAQLRDGVRVEIQGAHANVQTARDRYDVAREAVATAAENYRIVRARQSAQAATSFDVLDAETQLTQARADVSLARASYLLARAELAYAMGGDAQAIIAGGTP